MPQATHVGRLRRAGISEDYARVHADAMEEALRESVATKSDIARLEHKINDEVARLEHKIDLAVRDLTNRMGVIAVALFAALARIKFFG